MFRLTLIVLSFLCLAHAASKAAKTSPKAEINYSYEVAKIFFSLQSSTQVVYAESDDSDEDPSPQDLGVQVPYPPHVSRGEESSTTEPPVYLEAESNEHSSDQAIDMNATTYAQTATEEQPWFKGYLRKSYIEAISIQGEGDKYPIILRTFVIDRSGTERHCGNNVTITSSRDKYDKKHRFAETFLCGSTGIAFKINGTREDSRDDLFLKLYEVSVIVRKETKK